MSTPPFDPPRLHTLYESTLPLSGQALMEIMQAVLQQDVPFRFCARGWSMTPFIKDGDLITVAPLGSRSPGRGDVFAFSHPVSGKLVVHRAVAKCDTGLWIQGDSVARISDGIIPFENLLGRVIRIERDGQRVWLGLGPERYIIARLSHMGFLIPLRRWLAPLRKFFCTRKG